MVTEPFPTPDTTGAAEVTRRKLVLCTGEPGSSRSSSSSSSNMAKTGQRRSSSNSSTKANAGQPGSGNNTGRAGEVAVRGITSRNKKGLDRSRIRAVTATSENSGSKCTTHDS